MLSTTGATNTTNTTKDREENGVSLFITYQPHQKSSFSLIRHSGECRNPRGDHPPGLDSGFRRNDKLRFVTNQDVFTLCSLYPRVFPAGHVRCG